MFLVHNFSNTLIYLTFFLIYAVPGNGSQFLPLFSQLYSLTPSTTNESYIYNRFFRRHDVIKKEIAEWYRVIIISRLTSTAWNGHPPFNDATNSLKPPPSTDFLFINTIGLHHVMIATKELLFSRGK